MPSMPTPYVAGSVLWQVNLGPSVPATLLFGQYGDIANEVGILSTGVIDLQRSVLYVVADVSKAAVQPSICTPSTSPRAPNGSTVL